MPQIPGREFWSEEAKRLWDELAPAILTIVQSGGEGGFDRLPDGVKVLMDWDVFNQDVINYLREYRLDWVQKISKTTRDQAVDAIEDWIRAGEPLPVLEKRIGQIISPSRAKNIATTEVTRIYARGNQLAWQATGLVSGKKWQTSRDDLVCPLCSPLHDRIVEIDGIYDQTMSDIADSEAMRNLVGGDAQARRDRAGTLLRHSGASSIHPPRHVGCRCYLLPVVSEREFGRQLRQGLSADIDVDAMIAELRNDERVVMV